MAIAELDVRLLSVGQSGIWAAQMLDPESPAYNIGEYIEILGPVDPDLFESALRQVVSESDALHLRIIETADGLRQYIGGKLDWEMSHTDVSDEIDPLAAAETWMYEDMARVVDLARGPLFGYALFRVAQHRYLWYARYHHLCCDGFGGWLIVRRMADVYSALVERREIPTSRLGAWYDLLDKEERYRLSEQYQSDRDFWRHQLENRPEPVTLSGRPPAQPASFRRHTDWISPSLVNALVELGAGANARLPQVVTAATAVYQYRLTG